MTEDEKLSENFQSPFHFFPPLAMQRCAFCLGILKRLRVRSVLELGCGEGTLLGLLTNSAIALGEFPSSSDLDCVRTRLKEEKDAEKRARLGKIDKIIQETPELDVYERDLHLELLLGLDLEEDKLVRLHELIKQANPKYPSDSFQSNTRWEPLKVELWCGDLSVNNARFDSVECIVMSEVIEHLFQDQLDDSIPLIFGKYQPNWIVITTPNFEFNEHIDQYSSPQRRSQHRYLDPTGRSNRFFRDSDHKFEWTQPEFIHWCQSISRLYDYNFEITGCGSYKNYFNHSLNSSHLINQKIPKPQIPIPEFPEKFFATQIVVFEKRKKRILISNNNIINSCDKNDKKAHKLIGTEDYTADELSNKASAACKILESVKGYLLATQQKEVQLRELWLCNSGLDKLCGGKLIELLLSFADEEDWEFQVKPKSEADSKVTGMDAIWITWLTFKTNFRLHHHNSSNNNTSSRNSDSHWMNSWK